MHQEGHYEQDQNDQGQFKLDQEEIPRVDWLHVCKEIPAINKIKK